MTVLNEDRRAEAVVCERAFWEALVAADAPGFRMGFSVSIRVDLEANPIALGNWHWVRRSRIAS